MKKLKLILPIVLLLVAARSYADLIIKCDGTRMSNYATVVYTQMGSENGISGTLFCTGDGGQGCETPCIPQQHLIYGTFSFNYQSVMNYVSDQIVNHSMPSGSTLYLGVVPISWSTLGTQVTINIATNSDLSCPNN